MILVHDMPPAQPKIEVAGQVSILHIRSGDRQFALRKEVRPCLGVEESLWTCELGELHLLGFGRSPEEAVERFMDDFAATYDGLIDDEDEALTEDARRLRDALRSLIVAITPVESVRDVDPQQSRSACSLAV